MLDHVWVKSLCSPSHDQPPEPLKIQNVSNLIGPCEDMLKFDLFQR